MAAICKDNSSEVDVKTYDVAQQLEQIETGERLILSPAEDRRVLRKIDLYLLPIMAVSYLFQFLDKSALGYTAILGLNTDLDLSGQDFSRASAIYYVGYLVASYPAGWLIVRYPVGKVIAGSVLLWGAVLMLTATCFNPGALLATRLLLGFLESAVGPGLTVIIAMWYKRSEQPLRMGAWFMGNVIAGFVGGIVSCGIGHIQSIAPWKAVFLVFGALTLSWSVVVYFFLPDTPMTAKFLDEQDRIKAVERVAENKTGIKNNVWKLAQAVEATLDVKIWLLVIIQLSTNVANGGVQSFSSIVIKGFGLPTLTTLLVQMISTAFQLVFVLLSSGGSTYFTNARTYFLAANLSISIVGSAMIRQFPHSPEHEPCERGGFHEEKHGEFDGMLTELYIEPSAMTIPILIVCLKFFIAYCLGNIIGPQLFVAKESPVYRTGFLSIVICYGIGICACFMLRFYLIWLNEKRQRPCEGDIGRNDGDIVNAFVDKTDKEEKTFRYVY